MQNSKPKPKLLQSDDPRPLRKRAPVLLLDEDRRFEVVWVSALSFASTKSSISSRVTYFVEFTLPFWLLDAPPSCFPLTTLEIKFKNSSWSFFSNSDKVDCSSPRSGSSAVLVMDLFEGDFFVTGATLRALEGSDFFGGVEVFFAAAGAAFFGVGAVSLSSIFPKLELTLTADWLLLDRLYAIQCNAHLLVEIIHYRFVGGQLTTLAR